MQRRRRCMNVDDRVRTLDVLALSLDQMSVEATAVSNGYVLDAERVRQIAQRLDALAERLDPTAPRFDDPPLPPVLRLVRSAP